MRSQLRVTALCCGLCSKQKQLKNPTEESFKEQSLPPPPPPLLPGLSGSYNCKNLREGVHPH